MLNVKVSDIKADLVILGHSDCPDTLDVVRIVLWVVGRCYYARDVSQVTTTVWENQQIALFYNKSCYITCRFNTLSLS